MRVSSNVYKHGYLICLIFIGIIQGIQNDVMVPTLPSLCQKLNVSYELISRIKSFDVIPNIFALILVGILHDTYPFMVPYLMISECIILSLSLVIIAYTKSLWVFGIFYYLQSGAILGLNNGGQWNVLRLFKDQSVGKMQLYHLGYGIGAILGGLICRPFLPSDKSVKSVKLTKYCSNLLKSTQNQTQITPNVLYNSTITTSPLKPQSTNNFEYAFLVAAGLDLVAPIIFGLYHFLMPRPDDIQDYTEKKREPLSKSISPKNFSPNRPGFGICMAILLFVFYVTYMTGVLSIGPFIVVFATDPCKNYSMSQQTGATLATVVNAAFLLGRVFSSFTVNLNPILFLLIHNTANVVSLIFLSIYGNDYVLSLWICMCIIRFMNGVNYPGGTATFNRYIVISGSFISLAFIGSAFGAMIGQNIGSIFIDNYPSIYNIYSGFIGYGSLLVVVVILCIIGLTYKQREFTNSQTANEIKRIEKPGLAWRFCRVNVTSSDKGKQ